MKMKSYLLNVSRILLIAAGLFLVISACKKDEDNSSDDIFWNGNWLVGTWEGTTPAIGDPMFDNKKIKLVIEEAVLKHTDTVPHNTVQLWYYTGTFYWDVDGLAPWHMKFVHGAYPIGYCSFDWQSASMLQAGVTINNISLRVGDTVSLYPNRELDFDLDWGPYNDYNREVPGYLDFYGDIEMYIADANYRADYPPNAGSMIRLTKK
jgi:hypothetical protein